MPDSYMITLADSSEYPVDWCGVSNGILAIQIKTTEMSLLEIATIFSDKTKTNVIVFSYGEMVTRHEGFTVPIMVHDMRLHGGGLLVQLRKEVN